MTTLFLCGMCLLAAWLIVVLAHCFPDMGTIERIVSLGAVAIVELAACAVVVSVAW